MQGQIITIILSVGFSQAILGGMMMMLKKKAALSDKILAVWLFCFAFQQLVSILNRRFILTAFPITPFVYGPLLYIYVHSLIRDKEGLKRWYIAMFIPALVFTVLAIVFREKQILLYDSFLSVDGSGALRFSYAACVIISFIVYPIATFAEIDAHRRELKNVYSYTSRRITLGWALFVSISFFVFYFGIFVLGLVRVLTVGFPVDPEFIGYGVMLFYSFAFSIFAYQQERIYPRGMAEVSKAYRSSGLDQREETELAGRLTRLMEDKKLYLNSCLSLMDVAEALTVPRHYITQVLSRQLATNFYSFVNTYRVREAVRRLESENHRNDKLLSIAYDSGFNSKSSFNAAFKTVTGKTPSEFRQKRFFGAGRG